jgi:hypothetical protein
MPVATTSQRALAQHVLQMTRTKLERETSASEPRLHRLLVCANMADTISSQCLNGSRSNRDAGHPKSQHPFKRGCQPGFANDSGAFCMKELAVSLGADKNGEIRTVYPHPNNRRRQQLYPLCSRPRASACDRAAFRKSIIHERQQDSDNTIESDSESETVAVSDSENIDGGEYEDKDEEESGYASDDETEAPHRRTAQPVRTRGRRLRATTR